MPLKKQVPPAAARQAPGSDRESTTSTTASSTGRKPWIRRTPIEVVLEQITRQEKRVAEMREELAQEERELKKLQQAKTVLEST